MKKSEEQQAKQKTKWNSYSVERGKKYQMKNSFRDGDKRELCLEKGKESLGGRWC